MFRFLPLIVLSCSLFSGCIKIELIPIKYAPTTNVPEQPDNDEESPCSKESTTLS